jgi:hypothetical protein
MREQANEDGGGIKQKLLSLLGWDDNLVRNGMLSMLGRSKASPLGITLVAAVAMNGFPTEPFKEENYWKKKTKKQHFCDFP